MKTDEEIKKEPKKDNRVSLPCEWPYRLIGNIVLLSLIFAGVFLVLIIKTDFVSEKLSNLKQSVLDHTSNLGFSIDDIVVEGRNRTNFQQLSDTIDLARQNNILAVNLKEMKENLETLPWIKNVTIKRSFFPNILHISIEERQVLCIWQMDNRFYPIDDEGNVINIDFILKHPKLLIVGRGAPENIIELLKIIETDEEVYNRIKAAIYVSNRRWNIVLDDFKNGITVKLPEKDVAEAWKKLLKLNTTQGLLKRKLTIVDLRLKEKVIIKLGKTNLNDVKLEEREI